MALISSLMLTDFISQVKVISLLWIVIVFLWVYFPIIVFLKIIYRSSRDNYKCLRRESRLLNALVKDNQKASEVQDLINGEAGVSILVGETHRSWLKRATSVAKDAKKTVKLYKTRGPSLVNLLRTLSVNRRIVKMNRQIRDHLSDENRSLRKVCESLQLSFRNVTCLMDRPIDHDYLNTRPSFRRGIELNQQVDDMMRASVGASDKTRVQHAFLEDLLGIWMESELENAWLTEAQRLVEERNEAMVELSDILVDHKTTTSWFSGFEIRESKSKLLEEIEHADTMLSDLLDAKERYSLKLFGRESSKPNAPQQIALEAVVSSAKERISRLGQDQNALDTRVYKEVIEVFVQLEQTQNLFKEMKVPIEFGHHTRDACFAQLKRILWQVEALSERVMNTVPFAFPYISRSYLAFRSQIKGLEKANSRLQKSIENCKIEMVKDSSSVVGLEQDIHTLVSKLKAPFNEAERSYSVICCITGMKGIGKTTLAKEIFNHTSVINHFRDRRLLSLSSASDGISSVLDKVKKDVETWKAGGVRTEYLLVFDNLFSMKAWDELETALPQRTSNVLIKILVTTCDKEVASHLAPGNIHHLRLRTKDESWDLFTQIVPMTCKMVDTQLTEEEETDETKKKEALVWKIVRRAGGLPFSILHIGYLLVGKKMEDVTLEELLRVLDNVTRGEYQSPWVKLWKANEEDFKSQEILSNCLASFEIIPFNYEMPARRVVALWVARGLVKSEDAEKTPEVVAHEYLSELINRNMIQVVERRLNGKVKTCRFPAALREIWLQRPRDIGTIRAWSLTTSQDGQLACHFDDNNANHNYRIHGFRATLPNLIHEVRHPRSIMFFDTREGRQPGDDIGKFLQKGIKSNRFHELLVLDLEGIFRPTLPRNIGELKHLTYLGLRWTQLEKIPSSVGNLKNLQTLDMKNTYIQTLPITVWKLKKLRHLYLNNLCRIALMPKPSSMALDDLQTLSGAFLDGDSPLKHGLDKLNNLRKLDVAFHLKIGNQEDLEKLILQLTKLTSLSLSSVNEKSEPQDLRLADLSGLENLSVLYLFGRLTIASITTDQLPKSLKEIILSATRLEADPMPVLGTLPNLKSLSFLADSYNGQVLVCSTSSFPELLDLKLWSLSRLKSLIVNTGAMKNLREMEIRSCKSFEVSTGLTHLKTLQELKLNGVRMNYVQDVRNKFAEAINRSLVKFHSPKIKVEDILQNE